MLGFLKRGAQRLATGASGMLRGGQTGALCTQDAHARFQEAVLQGNVWSGANAQGTPVTTQTTVSATTPALVLYNPINSPVNLVLWTFTVGVTTGQTASNVILLAYNGPSALSVPTGPTATTLAVVTNMSLGLNQAATQGTVTGWGQCYQIATLSAAPLAFRYCAVITRVSAANIGAGMLVDHIDGEVIVPPGVAVSVQAVGSTGIPIVASFTWEESPIIQ